MSSGRDGSSKGGTGLLHEGECEGDAGASYAAREGLTVGGIGHEDPARGTADGGSPVTLAHATGAGGEANGCSETPAERRPIEAAVLQRRNGE